MAHRGAGGAVRLGQAIATMRRGLAAAPADLWPILAMTAAWVLLLYGATGGGALDPWVENWGRWDAHLYLRIWQEGYAADPALMAFPPGFPVLTGALSSVTPLSFFGAGSVISLVSLVMAGTVLAAMVKRDFGVPGPLVFAFWLCGPAAYFALAPYSDLLFCVLLFSAWYWLTAPTLTRSERFMLIIVLLLLPLIRITGLALLALLLLRRWQALALLPGLGLFLWLNHQTAGNAFHFLAVQKAFLMPEGQLLDGLHRSSTGLSPVPPVEQVVPFLHWLQFNAVPMTQLLLLGLTSLWLLWRRHWVLAVSLMAILLMSHNQAFWRSVVRYNLVLWPLVSLPVLCWIRSRLDRAETVSGFRHSVVIPALCLGAVMMLSLMMQLRFAAVFHRGGWGF